MNGQRNFCDRVSRRDVLRVGLGSSLAGSIGLPQLLAAEAAAKHGVDASRDDVSLIILFLQGGLATIDTLDLKPEAPAEFRGEFKPIDSVVPGLQVCEHTPELAKVADRFSLLRNFTHHDSGHGSADHAMLTGYFPRAGFNGGLKPNNHNPAHGSIIAKTLGPRGSVPPYVCLPKMHNSGGPAYLGSNYAPFVVDADPNAPDFSVPDLVPPLTVDSTRLDSRHAATLSMYAAAPTGKYQNTRNWLASVNFRRIGNQLTRIARQI